MKEDTFYHCIQKSDDVRSILSKPASFSKYHSVLFYDDLNGKINTAID